MDGDGADVQGPGDAPLAVRRHALQRVQDRPAVQDLAKDRVLAVQVGGLVVGDEELLSPFVLLPG